MCLVEIKKQSIKFLITFNSLKRFKLEEIVLMRMYTSSRVKRKRFHGKVNFKFDNLIRGAWYSLVGA